MNDVPDALAAASDAICQELDNDAARTAIQLRGEVWPELEGAIYAFARLHRQSGQPPERMLISFKHALSRCGISSSMGTMEGRHADVLTALAIQLYYLRS